MPPHPIKILIVNPNTNQSMTDALRPAIDSLAYNNSTYTYHTSPPSGIPSINTPHDAALSTTHTLPPLLPLLPSHHAVLIACYSPHPLVNALQSSTSTNLPPNTLPPHTTLPLLPPAVPVTGIFEASLHTALQLLRPGETFGIVSTGDVWKGVLEGAVRDILGRETVWGGRFVGVECVGVGAGELHDEGGNVEGRVKGATRRLVEGSGSMGGEGGKGRLGVVILGCAGMVGMEGWVRIVVGGEVRVVDGVRAGVGVLQGLVRGAF